MTNEEALKLVRHGEYAKADEKIVEALKKQIPDIPDWHPDGLSEYDYNEVWYSCPFCGNEIKEGVHHCKCGQRIDWGWRK